MTREDITDLFPVEPSSEDYRRKHAREAIHSLCRTLASHIADVVPAGVARTEALKRLREVAHWCNDAIDFHADPQERT